MGVRLRGIVVVSLVTGALSGCGGDRAARSASPGAHAVDLVQIPADAVAVVDLDLPRVRRSALWHGVRRLVEHRSSFATRCPDVLATARSATVGLRLRPQSEMNAAFVILRGVDRARTLACLRAPATGALAPPAAEPSPTRPASCQRYDEAVHQLVRCKRLPATVAGEAKRAQTLLARAAANKATAADPSAACTGALEVVERIDARRRELGWLCEDELRHELSKELEKLDERESPDRVIEVDASTFQLGPEELVHFLNDDTAVTVRRWDDGELEPLRAELAVMLARPATPRWYDAPRATRNPAPAIWLAIDPSLLLETDPRAAGESGEGGFDRRREQLPGRIVGTVDVERDLYFDLHLMSKNLTESMFIPELLARALADDETRDLLPSVTAVTTCAASPPTGSRTDRCTRTIAHARTLQLAHDTEQTRVQQAKQPLFDQSELLTCVEKPWSERFLACIEAASTADAMTRCYAAEPARTLTSIDDLPPVCGAHGIRVQARIPLLVVESLKLLEVAAQHAERDCIYRWRDAPSEILVGPSGNGSDKIALAAMVCAFGQCTTVDLGAAHTGHSDRRWHQHASVRPTTCAGPFSDTPDRDKLYPVNEGCPESEIVRFNFEGKTTRICRGAYPGVCATLPTPAPIHEVSIDTHARWAAVVSGPPGRQTIETWELASKRRLGTFSAGTTTDRPCARAQVLDDALLVSTGACGARDAQLAIAGGGAAFPATLLPGAHLATLQGRRIAPVAGAQPLAIVARPFPISGKRWAFVAASGDEVVIQDVATGVVERRIATGEPGEPGKLNAGADALGNLVIAYGGTGPRAGSVTIVEVATSVVRSIPSLPECPPDLYLP